MAQVYWNDISLSCLLLACYDSTRRLITGCDLWCPYVQCLLSCPHSFPLLATGPRFHVRCGVLRLSWRLVPAVESHPLRIWRSGDHPCCHSLEARGGKGHWWLNRPYLGCLHPTTVFDMLLLYEKRNQCLWQYLWSLSSWVWSWAFREDGWKTRNKYERVLPRKFLPKKEKCYGEPNWLSAVQFFPITLAGHRKDHFLSP